VTIRAGLPPGTEIELWWHDEARIGQKNKITRRWARRGTRPRAPHDQRTLWAYIFGAICPAKGKGAGLVLPYCDTQSMVAQLEEISQAVAPGAHAVLLLDQAGWHVSAKLPVPDNITLLQLPPRSPELNPVENVWQLPHATTGCRTGSSDPTTRSSSIAARLGTSSSTSPGRSCRSECATGHTGSDQRTLV
jgi:DDE superfamily endonuclease